MALPLPKLDDRTYTDLVAEAQALIPSLYPAWTNHNPTDPGMVLIELFAWLAELLLYRIDQIPAANEWTFLKLLNDTRPGYDADWQQRQTLSLAEARRQTILGLRERQRAVTAADFEWLALTVWPGTEEAKTLRADQKSAEIRQARCVPQRNLAIVPPATTEAPGHMSLVIVPDTPGDVLPLPTPDLLKALAAWLETRRLLGVCLHVVEPTYVPVTITATLWLRPDYAPTQSGQPTFVRNQEILDAVQAAAKQALADHFAPVLADKTKPVWPLGRHVYRSEIYQLLDALPGVDYVAEVQLSADEAHIKLDDQKAVSGIILAAHELVTVKVLDTFTVKFVGQEK